MTDPTVLFLGGLWTDLELWARKALECLDLSELLFRILGDNNVGTVYSTDNGGLTFKVSEGSKLSTGPFV